MNRLLLPLALALSVAGAFASNDVTGFVVDATAKPVAGAHVYVYTAYPKIGVSTLCPSCYRDCGKHQSVDAKGQFRIGSLDPSLVFTLLAVADGYEPVFVRKIDPVASPITMVMNPRSAADADRLIIGVVVDPDGKPVVGASVEPKGYRILKQWTDGI
jgi:hypothetical protein